MAEASGKAKFIHFSTYPFDPRFPNTNQTGNCTQNFTKYHKCIDRWGLNNEGCEKFKKAFTTMCPSKMLEDMKDQMMNGVFHGMPDGRKRDEDGMIIAEEEAGEEEH